MTEQEKTKRLAEWAGIKGWVGKHGYFYIGSPDHNCPAWNPYTSLDHARMLEDEVERRGLQSEYACEVINIINVDNRSLNFFWLLIHASAAQRCEAVLRLMEGEKNVQSA